MDRPRKAPAIERFIRDISADDIKVRVVGRVAEVKEGSIILEDDTGRIQVITDEPFNQNSLIRVFARPSKEDEKLVLHMEFAQDMAGLDEKLYKKLYSLKQKEDLNG